MSAVVAYFTDLQERICAGIEAWDSSGRFSMDTWERGLEGTGGGGRSRMLSDGCLFEKAGVNFSRVFGSSLPPTASVARPQLAGRGFEAAGVSLVLHPTNPYVPTTHMNVRCFRAFSPAREDIWWFGGGFDLTPYYPFEEDVVHWHRSAASACAPYGPGVYPKFKAWCDRYFYLPHRRETRGVGGLFFDDLNEWGFEASFGFVQAVGDSFLAAYGPIVERRRALPYGGRERAFQLYRRGRYVEFNLVYDRGTLFGLQSGGRTESILMSLPPLAAWEYNYQPAPGSAEAALYTDFLPVRDWL